MGGTPHEGHTRSRSRGLVIATLVWLSAVVGGLGGLLVYSSRPGDPGTARDSWPATSRLPRGNGVPTLVLFAHPKCPCTRATMGELAKVVTRAERPFALVVAFYRPSSEPESWSRTDLRADAESIPRATVQDDLDGREATLFGATTSGHAVLYDARGTLVYAGGITASRGHHGDNALEDGVVAFLNGGTCPVSRGPTFGCSLGVRESRAAPEESSR